MRTTIPVPGGGLPQQLYHRTAVWGDGVLPGRGPQANAGASPHASAGGPYLLELSHWVILWIVLYGILGGRESVGTLPTWTALVLGVTLLGSFIAEVSFAWRTLVH